MKGTWSSYPVVTLTGPYRFVTVQNTATDVSFTLSVAISSGQKRVIDLTPGSISITDASGNNKFGDLAPSPTW